MNVLFWSETYPPSIGGAEVWGSRFVDVLIRRGHRVLVVTRTDPNPDCPKREADGPAPIRRFPFWESIAQHHRAPLFGIRADIADLKRAFQPDVVQLSHARLPWKGDEPASGRHRPSPVSRDGSDSRRMTAWANAAG